MHKQFRTLAALKAFAKRHALRVRKTTVGKKLTHYRIMNEAGQIGFFNEKTGTGRGQGSIDTGFVG